MLLTEHSNANVNNHYW
uniref:Uncharacterized protein n=1 Tax=Anguilla anguilla TaxID=7936 RepID=A0A0E9VRF0_ANGAN